jgi:hypothetical protein
MKTGGQNAHIGKDPVFLHQPEAILTQMYAGGYTAVADASKFFYQFPTAPSERKYLGLLHPVPRFATPEYLGLPMGSSNSPAIAGRMGASFSAYSRRSARTSSTASVNSTRGMKV